MIRKAVPDDINWITRCQVAMADETEGLRLETAVVRKGVTTVLLDSSHGFYLIYEEKGQPAGCLMVTKEWSDWRAQTVWWIQSLYVLPGWRQKGIFSSMFAYLKEQVLQSDDIAGIRLYVDRLNSVAQKVYETVGMNGAHYRLYEWMKQ